MAFLFGKTLTNDEFIKAWGEKAVERYAKEKVLPSLPICQAILESGWGTSGISQTLFNYHGMNWYGDSVTKEYKYEKRTTQQERNGVMVDSVEYFCKFDNIDEELDCYYKWLNRNKAPYKAIHGNTDALKNFELIKQAGYATSSQYTQSLTRIYNQYPQIRAYDDMVLNTKPSPKTTHYYFVQVGAFKNKGYADNYMKIVKSKGFPAFIKEEGGYYKVQTGAFTVKVNAEKQVADLSAKGIQAFISEGDIAE